MAPRRVKIDGKLRNDHQPVEQPRFDLSSRYIAIKNSGISADVSVEAGSVTENVAGAIFAAVGVEGAQGSESSTDNGGIGCSVSVVAGASLTLTQPSTIAATVTVSSQNPTHGIGAIGASASVANAVQTTISRSITASAQVTALGQAGVQGGIQASPIVVASGNLPRAAGISVSVSLSSSNPVQNSNAPGSGIIAETVLLVPQQPVAHAASGVIGSSISVTASQPANVARGVGITVVAQVVASGFSDRVRVTSDNSSRVTTDATVRIIGLVGDLQGRWWDGQWWGSNWNKNNWWANHVV